MGEKMRNDEWGTFGGNRIKEICKLSAPNQWYHVPGKMNPAALPSRGCSPQKLVDSRWWEGPEWLRRSKEFWPASEEEVDEQLVQLEKKKASITLVSVEV